MEKLETFSRARLHSFPTPIAELANLSRKLGDPRLFIKRDDLAGPALGGNKTRKLEYLIGDALARGCDSVVTGGARQSNHCRLTAAAAALSGLECHLVLGGDEPATFQGNALLDRLLGAKIHWAGPFRKGEKIPELVTALEGSGHKPYVIPYGGSNATGALGFVRAAVELQDQIAASGVPISHVLFASSSGGTHAGLLVGAAMTNAGFEVHGIKIDKEETGEAPLDDHIAQLVGQLRTLLGVPAGECAPKLLLNGNYNQSGYGVVGDLEREAIQLLARTEGIIVDPVYTGRAFGALLDLIRRKTFRRDDNILFWHTGGVPALFAHVEHVTIA